MMNSDPDFSVLRQLLHLRREDILTRTGQPDLSRFLQELHRRQRSKLLTPVTPWAYALHWFQHRLETLEHLLAGFPLRPAFAYTSGGMAFTALAIIACLSLSPQVQLGTASGANLVQISLHLPGGATPTVGLLPTASAALNFSEQKLGRVFGSASQFAVATPSFVLSDTHAAYDSRAAF